MKQRLKLRGQARVEVRNADGSLFAVRDDHNLITNVGLAGLAGLFNGSGGNDFRYIALGTGTAPASESDTELQTEVDFGGGERKLADTRDQVTTVITDDTARNVAEFTITAGFDLSEIGLFDDLNGGVLAARRVFSPVTISPGQSVIVTWRLILSA